MSQRFASAVAGVLFLLCLAARASGQPPAGAVAGDTRTQYPSFLANSYVGAGLGGIFYAFSNRQLEPGLHAASVEVPHAAVRVDLFGHEIAPRLSVQASYMRPVRYLRYVDVNGNQRANEVSLAFGGVTLRGSVPIAARLAAWGEGGLGIVSRFGLTVNGTTVLREAHFATPLVGGGIEYKLHEHVDVVGGLSVLPGRARFDQPATKVLTLGVRYWMRKLPPERVAANREGGAIFPLQMVRVGYSTNLLTYGANTFFSRIVPVFWSGDVETRRGLTLDYQRNLFHTRSRFAFDVGASASYWKSNAQKQVFRTFSVYPVLRFIVHHSRTADYYASYSLAGPSYISRVVIDGRDTGVRFTFQDFLGIGAYVGRGRRYDVEIGIKHYSNGNIFTQNAAVKIPLTVSIGRTF
jgi:Lipid A 3-O-deacylase (PagL)